MNKKLYFQSLLLLFGLVSHRSICQTPTFSCGTVAEHSDYIEVTSMLNSSNFVAGGFTGEVQVPLHIIYVNKDDGTPPQNTYSIIEAVNLANQIYEGIANVYICGYHHINNSNFNYFEWLSDRFDLYDYYHVDECINVYIVTDIVGASGTGVSGIAAYPWAPKNNMIVMNKGAEIHTLAHELGHHFGLYHTHEGTGFISSTGFCNLLDPMSDPATTGDMIADTPVDPGITIPGSVCANPEGCPTATSTCIPTCTTSGGQTYTYTGYLTNNIMSYYRLCLPQILTDGQITRIKENIMNYPGLSYINNGIAPSCNNDIAEYGVINKYCQYGTLTPDVVPIKGLRLKLRNEVTGWETPPIKTTTDGSYFHFSNDFSNLSYVTIEPRPSDPNINMILVDPTIVPANYNPRNGFDMDDILLAYKAIISGVTILSPYSRIAADVNLSGSLTTFDIVSMTKVNLGIAPDFPAGTWHYIPEYYFEDAGFSNDFEQMPYTAAYHGLAFPTYLDQVVLDMDSPYAENPSTWSFRGIKMGDLNCNMVIDNFSPSTGNSLITGGTSSGPCVNIGDIITVNVMGMPHEPLLGYQIGLDFDQNSLEYLGSSSGDLQDFSADRLAQANNQIKALWFRNDLQPEPFSTPKSLFKLHFKVLDDFCDISNTLSLNDNVNQTVFYNNGIASMPGSVSFAYQKVADSGKLLGVYPNPLSVSASFSFQVFKPCSVEIRLSDYYGGVITMSQDYSGGVFSYTFNNLNSLANGPLNYSVKIGEVVYSGILMKSLP